MAHNGTENGILTAKQEAVAFTLASGRTIKEAAGECNAGERTIKRWLAERPAVPRRVAELQAEMIGRALERLADGMTEAADTLRELLGAKAESVRLGAARSILELGSRLSDRRETLVREGDMETKPAVEMNDYTLMARLCRLADLQKQKAAGEHQEQSPAGPNGPVNPA